MKTPLARIKTGADLLCATLSMVGPRRRGHNPIDKNGAGSFRYVRKYGSLPARRTTIERASPKKSVQPRSVQTSDALPALQQPLRLLAEFRRNVGPRQRVGDVGGEEADLGAAVVARPLELEAVEGLPLGERDHGVGELNLAAGAA